MLRVSHAGHISAYRAREPALVALGVELSLAAQSNWPAGDAPFRDRVLGRVAAGDVSFLQQFRSPRRRRELARTEFGPTAATTGGARPFALPLLHRGGAAVSVLATIIDTAGEIAAVVSKLRGQHP